MNLEGKIIGNRYEIIEKIGNGGMATVCKARCTILNRYVAVKVLREEFTTDEEFIKRFNSEAQAAASLTHPNIVSVYDVGQEYNIYYIVMELIQGKTLKQIISEEGALPWKWTINIAIQICSALEVAHKNGIVHRDIKPHNIIITEDGIAKVTDFGIAKAVSNSTITAFGTTIGSVHYFSPEHARGGYTDAKSDLYSLGVVMYEMVTGKVPFDADTPVSVALKHIQEEAVEPIELNSRIPQSVNNIIIKAMKKDTSLRYASAGEMIKDLSMVLKNPNGEIKQKSKDDFTKVIPTISEDMLENENIEVKKTATSERSKNRTSKNKKKGMFSFLDEKPAMAKAMYVITPILIVAFAALIFWGSWKITTKLLGIGNETVQTSVVQIPDVKGKQLEEAKQTLENSKIKYRIEENYNENVAQGYIISQSPEFGNDYDYEKSAPVTIVVSKGIKVVKMPTVKGKTYEDAVKEIEKAELVVERVEEISQTVQEGIVIKQEIEGNSDINAGTTVKIYVSIGTGLAKQTIPYVIDKDVETAKKELTDKKLEVNIIYQEDTAKSDGVILKQSIEVGKVVEEGTAITLTVNKIQEVKAGTVNINVKSLTGYTEKKDEDGKVVKPNNVSVRVAVNGETVDERSVAENTENVNVTVQGKGVIEIRVYIDEVRKYIGNMDLNGENTILDLK